jgi:hypothetical protein
MDNDSFRFIVCFMTVQKSGWQLEITPNRQIFVSHFGRPKFKVELIPKNGTSEMGFLFKGEWEDLPNNAMHWYMQALEFYQFAIKQPEFQRTGLAVASLQNQPPNTNKLFYPPLGLNPSQACDSSSPSI